MEEHRRLAMPLKCNATNHSAFRHKIWQADDQRLLQGEV